ERPTCGARVSRLSRRRSRYLRMRRPRSASPFAAEGAARRLLPGCLPVIHASRHTRSLRGPVSVSPARPPYQVDRDWYAAVLKKYTAVYPTESGRALSCVATASRSLHGTYGYTTQDGHRLLPRHR